MCAITTRDIILDISKKLQRSFRVDSNMSNAEQQPEEIPLAITRRRGVQLVSNQREVEQRRDVSRRIS